MRGGVTRAQRADVVAGPATVVVGVDHLAGGDVAGHQETAFGSQTVTDVPRPNFAVEPIGLGREREVAKLDLVQSGLCEYPDMAVEVHGEVENVVVSQPAFAGIIAEARWLDAGRVGRGIARVGAVA